MGFDVQQERAARNQTLFRIVNEHIEQLGGQFGGEDDVREYVCECLDTSCVERFSIPHDEYQRIRRNPTEFVLVPGHEERQVEEVVERNERWIVVRTLGAGAKLAAGLAHHSPPA